MEDHGLQEEDLLNELIKAKYEEALPKIFSRNI